MNGGRAERNEYILLHESALVILLRTKFVVSRPSLAQFRMSMHRKDFLLILRRFTSFNHIAVEQNFTTTMLHKYLSWFGLGRARGEELAVIEDLSH